MPTEISRESQSRVLIADDNYVIGEVIRRTLERAGYCVQVARDGMEAWQFLQSESFDLLITDYQMPGLTGEELCRLIRAEVRIAELPVMLLSAKGLEIDSAHLTHELGLDAIMCKPFSPTKLVESVARCLRSRSGAAAVAN